MTWNIIKREPTYGICSQCQRHECGIVNGEHVWVQSDTMFDKFGDPMVIGYNCVKSWADNLGITREVVEREVFRPPTDEELGAYVRKLVDASNKAVKDVGRSDHGGGLGHRIDSVDVHELQTDDGKAQVSEATRRTRRTK